LHSSASAEDREYESNPTGPLSKTTIWLIWDQQMLKQLATGATIFVDGTHEHFQRLTLFFNAFALVFKPRSKQLNGGLIEFNLPSPLLFGIRFGVRRCDLVGHGTTPLAAWSYARRAH
jgi:hypothetical protein